MTKGRFLLVNHPWLFLFLFIFATSIFNALITALLVIILKLSMNAPTTGLWVNILTHGLMAFIFVPFVMGFHKRSRPYIAYVTEIHLVNWQPVLKLSLLGVSCFLLLALSQIAGTLIYRLSQGLAVDLAFIRDAFSVASEFPLP